MKYFFDTYALVEIINQNQSYIKFADEIIITTSLNISELYYYLLINYNQQTADYWIKNLNLQFFNITSEIAVESARFRYKYKKMKLSYADCIGYILSLRNNLKFLTGDRQFKNMKNVEFVD